MNADRADAWSVRLLLGSAILWFLTWGLIWQARVNTNWQNDVFEPAVVAIQLGAISIATFVALYLREADNQVRGAIAGAIVLPFILLIVDLITLPELRDSLAGTSGGGGELAEGARLDFVQSMFDTFKWVVVTVVGFYFAAEASEKVTKTVEDARVARGADQVRIAQAQAQASGANLPANVLIPAPPRA